MARIGQARDRGLPLPGPLARRIRRLTGAQTSELRVHIGPAADRLNEALASRAFTYGTDIFLRTDQYRPDTAAGDALLAHEVAHALWQQAAGQAPFVQCKFGFEFELLIPVMSLANGNAVPPERMQVPKPRTQNQTTASPKIGVWQHGGFFAETDHNASLNHHRSGSWPADENMTNLEIVTDPLDEVVLSRDAVAQQIWVAATWAGTVFQDTIGGRRKADAFLNADPADVNWIGPAAGLENDRAMSRTAYVQETYGLRLDKVAEEFTSRANAVPPMLRQSTKWYMPLFVAGSTLPSAPTSQALKAAGDAGSPEAANELRGLFALMRYYVSMWMLPSSVGGLAKNGVGIFYYKSQLSTVRNDLAVRYQRIGDLLDDAAKRAAVCTAIGVKPSSLQWADDVLSGKRDSFFLDTVNPYSEELTAAQLGPAGNQSVGVVVENRDFRGAYPELKFNSVDVTKRYDPDEWAAIATRLYDRLRGHHGLA